MSRLTIPVSVLANLTNLAEPQRRGEAGNRGKRHRQEGRAALAKKKLALLADDAFSSPDIFEQSKFSPLKNAAEGLCLLE